MLILVLLSRDLCLQVFEICYNERVNDFNVLIVEGLQVVIHHGDILTKAFNLFFVFTEDLS
jgi:hypothetical protein